ncbi:MAG: hypothetical protein AAGA80_09965, partial [Cyanobacteria bacterium P01_F01_bin.143]
GTQSKKSNFSNSRDKTSLGAWGGRSAPVGGFGGLAPQEKLWIEANNFGQKSNLIEKEKEVLSEQYWLPCNLTRKLNTK